MNFLSDKKFGIKGYSIQRIILITEIKNSKITK